MRSLAYRSALAVLVGLLTLTGGLAGAGKAPSIKDIMARLHRGPSCLRTTIGRQLKTDAPDWEALRKETREFVELAEELRTKNPPVGHKESWAQLTEGFVGNAKALDEAARQHDRTAARRAHARLGNCKTCHDAHKPK